VKILNNNFGICHLSIIPVRQEPCSKSEMTTQLLYGETYKILKTKDSWFYIENSYDSYKGWLNYSQVKEISINDYNTINLKKKVFSIDLTGFVEKDLNKKNTAMVPIGSLVSSCEYLKQRFRGKTTENYNKNIIDISNIYLNTPYLWGGRNNYGIDCSGFTQNVYKIKGIFIKRDAYMQAESGIKIGYNDIEPGCLAFFGTNKITHVGILLNKKRIIHSFGKVRIDYFNGNGIKNFETKKITHNLLEIRKY
tara:strand:- start:655 stop:1407 length:753 start_codon:yes stop_codon:yes gene_type:complete